MLILYYEEIREREIILFSFLLILGGKSMSIQVKSLGLVKNEEIEIKAIASLEVEGMSHVEMRHCSNSRRQHFI